MEMKQRIESYIDLLNEIGQRVGDERTATVILAETGKDRRMDVIREERNSNGNEEQPASVKQIGYLKYLGAKDLPSKMTKKQASAMIDELAGQNGA